MTDAAAGENGRATIREVHLLLTETRHENEAQLRNMEERVIYSVNASETRILQAVGDLGARVTALEAWREESRIAHIERAAVRDERLWFIRAPIEWASSHWQIVVVIVGILLALLAFVVDTRIDIQPQG